jgi:predicted alpha/beta-hydrolase family hydrolase
VKIALNAAEAISGLLDKPDRARALFVFAHGAGAGMNHRSMGAIAAGLSQRGIATLRYQFLYMEKGGRRPDPPALAHAAVRAAVAEAARLAPGLPLIAGGRSFGGRMTSQAQAAAPLPGVKGLAFLAFPLHPAGEPGIERAAHLRDVHIPMLFLQGARDALADLALLRPMIDALDPRATLKLIEHADHSFTVPAKSGRTNAEAETELLDALAEWIARIAAA